MASRKRVENFSEKYSNLRQSELVKVFDFLNKISSFSKVIELCLNFYIGFCMT